MVTQQDLSKQREAKLEAAQAIHKAFDTMDEEITTEKLAECDKLFAEAEAMDVEIVAAKSREDQRDKIDAQLKDLKLGVGRKTSPDSMELDAATLVKVGEPAWKSDPNLGYASHQEFCNDVMETTRTKSIASNERLQFLSTAGSDEQSIISDPDGGYLVPEGLHSGILSVPTEGDFTSGRTTDIPMTTPVVNINALVDKDHSTSVSGGFVVGRRIETQLIATSRQKYEQIKLEATSLTGAAFATEEILSFSPISFAALMSQGFATQFPSHLLEEKLTGTGVGEMLGVANSDAVITIAKEDSQTNNTVVGLNIAKMRARCFNYGKAIWHANHDTLVTLMSANLSGAKSDTFLFAPGNGTDVPATLFGRPIFFTEYASTVGVLNDIMLVDWSQYLVGTLQGMQSASSVHVRFLNHEQTFKFWMSNDGAPWWRSALTPKNGDTLSPIVTLAERLA